MTVGGNIEGRRNWFSQKAFSAGPLRKPHKHLSINQRNCHLSKDIPLRRFHQFRDGDYPIFGFTQVPV